jgi:hypothetical protein
LLYHLACSLLCPRTYTPLDRCVRAFAGWPLPAKAQHALPVTRPSSFLSYAEPEFCEAEYVSRKEKKILEDKTMMVLSVCAYGHVCVCARFLLSRNSSENLPPEMLSGGQISKMEIGDVILVFISMDVPLCTSCLLA